MKAASKSVRRNSSDVYSAFRRLSSRRRRDVALRILKDEKVLADLYDHLLIKQSVDEVGRSVGWEAYRSNRN